MRINKLVLWGIGASLLVQLYGCATTDDPRKGGLFSYSPTKYEQRIKDREEALARSEAEQQEVETTKASLSSSKAKLQKEVNSLKKSIKTRQAKLDKTLAALKNSGQSEQVSNLQKKSAALKQQASQADKLSDLEQKKAEVLRLQKELKELELEADALSRL